MVLSLTQALEDLDAAQSVDDVWAVVREISVVPTGDPDAPYVFYSGAFRDGMAWHYVTHLNTIDPSSIRILDQTDAFSLLTQHRGLITTKLQELGMSDTAIDDFFDGRTVDGILQPGAFDVISGRFAESASGDVVTITPNGLATGVFGRTELAKLLDNPDVTSINGLLRTTWLEKLDTLDGDVERLLPYVNLASEVHVTKALPNLPLNFEGVGHPAGMPQAHLGPLLANVHDLYDGSGHIDLSDGQGNIDWSKLARAAAAVGILLAVYELGPKVFESLVDGDFQEAGEAILDFVAENLPGEVGATAAILLVKLAAGAMLATPGGLTLLIAAVVGSLLADALYPELKAAAETYFGEIYAELGHLPGALLDLAGFLLENNPFFNPPISPLVLDLDGDGLDVIDLDDSHAHFDLDEDGLAELTAWVRPDDAILARDVDGNGRIEGLNELFGSSTDNGFTELAELDSNADGKIDASDAAFSELRLWRDLDGDGISDQGELVSMVEGGIASIDLNASTVNIDLTGSHISHRSTFTRADGTTGGIDDIWFEHDQVRSINQEFDLDDVNPEVYLLPNLLGAGNLNDLYVAMTLRPELLTAMSNLVASVGSSSISALQSSFEQFLLQWAGVEGVNPTSRGGYVDARHLAFLESVHGSAWRGEAGESNPLVGAAPALEAYFDSIVEYYFVRFYVQSPLSMVLTGGDIALLESDGMQSMLQFLAYDAETDSVAFDDTAFVAGVASQVSVDGWAAAHEIVDALPPMWSTGLLAELGLAATELVDSLVAAGVTPTMAAYIARGLTFAGHLGTSAGEALTGTSGADRMAGAAGDDTVSGGTGNDTYYWAYGDGHDTIVEGDGAGADDRLVLDVVPGNVTVTKVGSDVKIVIAESSPGAGDGGSVLIKGLNSLWSDASIDTVQFADGTVWTRQQLRNLSLAGTSGDDTLIGFITGDTYRWSRGDGNDTIVEDMLNGIDRLDIAVTASAVTVTKVGADAKIVIAESSPGAGDGGSITVKNLNNSANDTAIETIVFADGTTWTRQQLRNLSLAGTSGNDTLVGYVTGDSYVWSRGSGHDTIVEDILNGVDRLDIAVAASAVTVTKVGSDAKILIAESSPGAGDGGSITITNLNLSVGDGAVESIVFADGTTWNRQQLRNLSLSGTSGNDTLVGYVTNDNYVWSRGSGHDTISEALGGGIDRLDIAVTASAVTVTKVGADAKIVIAESAPGAGDGGSITIKNLDTTYPDAAIDTIVFADGTTWTRQQLRNLSLAGTSGNDTLNGYVTNDNYSWSRGDGHDTISEAIFGGTDRLDIDVAASGVTVTKIGTDAKILIAESAPGAGDGGSITIKNLDYLYSGTAVETIAFADGTTWTTQQLRDMSLTGTAGNDTLAGYASGDRLQGLGGNDTLTGAGGKDTFIFGTGSGSDVVTDFRRHSAGGDFDTIEISGYDVNTFAEVLAAAEQVGTATVLHLSETETITLNNVTVGTLTVDDFRFV